MLLLKWVLLQPAIYRRHRRVCWELTRRTWQRWRVGHWWLCVEHWTGEPFFVWKLLSWLSKERIRIVEDLKGSWKTGTTCKQHMLNTSNTYYYYYFCYFHVYPLFSKTCVGDLEAFNGHRVKLWIMIGFISFP